MKNALKNYLLRMLIKINEKSESMWNAFKTTNPWLI